MKRAQKSKFQQTYKSENTPIFPSRNSYLLKQQCNFKNIPLETSEKWWDRHSCLSKRFVFLSNRQTEMSVLPDGNNFLEISFAVLTCF